MGDECKSHPGTVNGFLCETCKIVLCEKCKEEHDDVHDINSLQDISQNLMGYLNKEDDATLYEDICKMDDELRKEAEKLQAWFSSAEKRVIETVKDCQSEVLNEVTGQSNGKLGETREKMQKAPKLSSEERDKLQEEIKDIVMDEKYSLLAKYKDLYFQSKEKDELYTSTASSKPFWVDHIKKVSAISDEFLKGVFANSLKRMFTVPLLYIIPNKSNMIFTYDVMTKEKVAHKLEDLTKSNHFDSALVGNVIYIIGGVCEEAKDPLGNTYEYEILGKEGTLRKKANMLKGRFGHKVLAVGDSFVHALGGVVGAFLGTKYTNNCEKYDRMFDRWIEIKPMIEPKGYMTACHFKERFIYVFGGFKDDLCLESSANVEFFDTMVETEGWKFIKFNDEGSKWLPVSQAGALQLGRHMLLIFGGRVNKTKLSNDSYVYSIKDSTMKMLDGKLEEAKTFYQRNVISYKDRLYAFDADRNDLNVFDSVEAKWTLIKKEEWNKASS